MATLDRVSLKALIDLYITANGNKEITGPQVNEILTNIIDSTFFFVDDPRSVSSGVAFVDSVNGNDTTAQVGDMSKPFATMQEAHDQLTIGGTMRLVQGSFGSLTLNKNLSIIGYGRENCDVGGILMTDSVVTELDISTLNMSNLTINTSSGQGNVRVQGCNLSGNVTSSVSGGNLQVNASEISGNCNEIVSMTNCFVTGSAQTKVERGVYVSDNLITGSFLINDRTGGRVLRNTFDTGVNTPINWRTGFSPSQVGGKIDIYDNDFLSSAANAIEEVPYTNLNPMTARIWNNRYETTNLFNVIDNIVSRNQLNNQLT